MRPPLSGGVAAAASASAASGKICGMQKPAIEMRLIAPGASGEPSRSTILRRIGP
jgi:hypothetical protein